MIRDQKRLGAQEKEDGKQRFTTTMARQWDLPEMATSTLQWQGVAMGMRWMLDDDVLRSAASCRLRMQKQVV